MRFLSLAHLLEVVSSIAQPEEIIVLGSSSLLTLDPKLGEPGQLLEFSYDADLLLKPIDQDLASVLAEAVGEDSLFADRYSYYAYFLTPAIAETLPAGWEQRLGPVPEFSQARALNPYDLALVKLTLGRPKDLDLLKALLARRLIDLDQLRGHYRTIPLHDAEASKIGRNLRSLLASDTKG
jgi:hypothetical protein